MRSPDTGAPFRPRLAGRGRRSAALALFLSGAFLVIAALFAPGARDPVTLVAALVCATLAGYVAPRKRTVIWFAIVAASACVAVFLGDGFSGARASWIVASLVLIAITGAAVHHVRTLEDRIFDLRWRAELSAEAADLGLFRWDFSTDEVIANPRLRALFELPESGRISAAQAFAKIHPEDVALVRSSVEAARSTGAPYSAAFRVLRTDGSVRWLAGRGRVIVDAREGVQQFAGVNFDISDQKQAEQDSLSLVRELNHRIKNLFSVTNALISLSARYAVNVEDFAEATRARLTALNAAHAAALQDLRNRGAQMRPIIDAILSLQQIDRTRVAIVGEAAGITAGSASAWALILHELCNNAQKHGALRSAGGAIEISWTADAGRLHFSWRERGVENVADARFGDGFGTNIVQRLVEGYLEGRATFQMSPDGALITIETPLAA